MRKFTLFLMSLFLTVGAMAQTFVEPQVGKFYKIKGNHSTNPWLTAVVENGGIDVSSDEANAGIFMRTENGLQEVSTGNYIGTSNNQITLVTTADETLIEAADGGRFYIKTGGRYLYNNQPDYTREAGNLNAAGPDDTKWGFIEVDYDDPFNNKVFALDSYMDYIYCLTDGNTNIYTNGSFSGVADTRALWMPEIVKVGVYKIKNVHTGLYIGATQHNSSVQMSETPGNYEIAPQRLF